jgi:hypothetical protein
MRLRCTKRLLDRLRIDRDAAPTAPTTVLGDWYATLIITRPAHLVLCVSERSLLPVVFVAAPLAGLLPRFRDSVGSMLRAVGIGERAMVEELTEMADIAIAPTANRSVLGAINDLRRMLPFELDVTQSLQEAALRLAEAPFGPIGMRTPIQATLELFGSARS